MLVSVDAFGEGLQEEGSILGLRARQRGSIRSPQGEAGRCVIMT